MSVRPKPPIRKRRFTPETLVLHTARSGLREELGRLHTDCVGWALSCCGYDRSEAEDVLQSSYLKVLDGRAVYRSRSSLKTWVFGVIRRTAAEHRRRGALRRLVTGRSLDGLATADSAPNAAERMARADETERLIWAQAALPQRQREVLHLVFYQDLTIEEAAHILGVSLGTARTHYERGKVRLRELLEREDEP